MAITFPTNPMNGQVFPTDGSLPVTYIYDDTHEVWNIRSAVLMRKVDLFLGTPGGQTTTTVATFTTQIQSFTTNGAETVFFKDIKLDTDNTTIINTGGNLGMFSDRGDPTETGAVNFNLIG